MIRVLTLMIFFIIPINASYAGCSELAIIYSNNPESMEVNDLASLKKCVTDSLRNKLFSEEPVPAPTTRPVPPMLPPTTLTQPVPMPPPPAPPIMPVLPLE